ncbi:sugar isomerase domain-containing protein [Alkalicoccus daliensis]|uniref:Uncharacterized protein, contains SIS (Sugar ISomerase) phosphosugar binding domain n=1 Tax=Alkalicoccus daliensis TaxID=745820 RepID=A0A1H0GDP3_9BACI|nr:SIS domain-containing protein [Alkalicoccus daliensis]SDO04974.1 Uncharacterized protein, contains SIS (Sugar ISomerase) phosphosugar binding domain [Alkalicoccus daliensis]
MFAEKYYKLIQEHITKAFEMNKTELWNLSKEIALSINEDQVLHMFGCGHSHMITEELFYRAGGLVPVSPILETSLMLHEGAIKSSKMEKMKGYASPILDNYHVREGEFIVIVSNSGTNNVPIEMALTAKERGLRVIALTSSNYGEEESKHQSGKKLIDIADWVIDNTLPKGDALVEVEERNIGMAPGSTIIGSFLMNTLVTMIVEQLLEQKKEVPVLVSGNVTGGMEKNEKYLEKYRSKIKHL